MSFFLSLLSIKCESNRGEKTRLIRDLRFDASAWRKFVDQDSQTPPYQGPRKVRRVSEVGCTMFILNIKHLFGSVPDIEYQEVLANLASLSNFFLKKIYIAVFFGGLSILQILKANLKTLKNIV